MRLAGKVAIVTGAASGFGAETARRFVEEGACVCIADRLPEDGEAVAKALGAKAMFHELDVTDEAGWQRTAAATSSRYGGIDILVNNAGIGLAGVSELFDVTAWDRFENINAKGPFLGIKTIHPFLKSRGRGSIVNISSISACVGMERLHFGYAASKASVLGMSKNAACTFAADGIRVNAILPGNMTPMRTSGSSNPNWRDGILRKIPLGRIGTASDIANAAVFLASDESSYITGVELPVDGGYTAV